MKRLTVILLSGILSSAGVLAQEPAFLFEDFTPATIKIKDGTVCEVSVNLDANSQKLYYIDGDNVMEMTNISELDTLYADNRKFVMKNNSICEYIPKEYGAIFINKNIYYLLCKGREYGISRLSDLYAQFPDKTSDIKHIVREYGLSLKQADEAEKIFDFACTGALPEFTAKDLIGYWCIDQEYNRVPHSIIHFIDGNTAVYYGETDVVNLFHGTIGLQIPGFSGLFYCPQDDSKYGYTLVDGTVSISNGMTFKITKKGHLKRESTSLLYRKFEQRYFAEILPPLNDRRGNPERTEWGPVPGLTVHDPNPR